ncbi:MAG: winged helix-turn-helix transcriptional regulator, partial [Hyphomicrobiales bacterium]|nr:winged helix-turn-helix transcriptional regulator [Hyphomicrobiales bacterium]
MKNIKRETVPSTSARQEKPDDFDLKNFFPYLVRVYYRAVSEAVSSVYTEKFGLSVSEWRTMAVLGPHNSISASEIVEQSSMDKVAVSRAIKGLQAKGFLKRDIDGDDRRRAALRLTLEGRNTFANLVPKVKQ